MKNFSLVLPSDLPAPFTAKYVIYDRAGGTMKRRAASWPNSICFNSAILTDVAQNPTARRLHLEIEGYLKLDLELTATPIPPPGAAAPIKSPRTA
jgi:hypothetical protein